MAPFAFVVAGAVLLGSIGTVFVATTEVGTTAAADSDAGADLRAQAVLDRWLGQGGLAWSEGDDGAIRFASSDVALDWSAVGAMQGAAIVKDDENLLFDYEEARKALGIDALGADVHLRIQTLVSADGQPDLSGLRVAYIGDWEPIAQTTVTVAGEEEMVAQAQAHLNLSMGAATGPERGLVDASGVAFTDRVHLTASYPAALIDLGVVTVPLPDHIADATLLEGDVYPDLVDYLDGVLPDRLPLYDVVIIGSGVDHEALDDADLGGPLASFVEGGGAIVSFGGQPGKLDWSDDLLDEGRKTANRMATVPDHGHVLLNVPHDISWLDGYAAGEPWPLDALGTQEQDRTHLFQIVLGSASSADLAVTRDGALSDGHVLLSGHRPVDMIGDRGEAAAQDFVENVLSYFAQKNTTLDFGATAPGDRAVHSAQRTMHYTDPVEGQHVVRATLLYWQR